MSYLIQIVVCSNKPPIIVVKNCQTRIGVFS
jgi:hypothetical protein